MPINPIQNLPRIDSLSPARVGDAAGGSTATNAFSQLLDQSIRHITEQQNAANEAIGDFLNGEQEDPHHMMLAVQRADLAFDMFVQVRNKVISAYQEVMRMPE